ncbi:MAG TPA: ATP-binding protein [Candidatus Hydrogenedentes bacterium]|nr:ATP-binding protein [Candidatus Hydrogenedentota bacterium]HOL78116.1 ATP-binding protein [Candidatus Hydrogenedentota bacterium]HPO85596.1 ATP-binding protein [Candidatus Hydrogenedentota bacterium]
METLRILICDDEAGMRAAISRALRDFTVHVPEVEGEVTFRVEEAESGEQALDLISIDPPHILLLDHKLPGLSGLDVLERLSGKNLETLPIMITAYASIETAVRATKQGAYDFLPKPFTPSELKSTVAKAAKHFIITRQAQRLAEERRRVRFEFISLVAHELKAPINAVEGYLSVLRSGVAGDDPKTREEILDRCVQRLGGMRKIINDLLDLTRIESGNKRRELTEVNVCDVARTVIETALPSAQGRNISIHLDAEAPVIMTADRSEIEMILGNLVTNAVKYNRDNGKVTVQIRKRDGEVVMSVTDTGIGLTEEERAKLFQDFVRIKNEKTRNILGSGLGLSIVKKLVTLYAGEIRVKSQPDVGSTFTVILKEPRAEEVVPSAEPAANATTA